MDSMKTHGAFSWSELLTSDPPAAAEFYGKLFGWTLKTSDMGAGPYHLVHVGEAPVGGIMGAPPDAPKMPPTWGCYVTVDNVERTLATCAELGGKTLVPPMDVPGVGRMAVLQDPQGAMLSVITYAAA